jgi:hypothetical protein
MPFCGCAPQRSAVRGKETAQIRVLAFWKNLRLSRLASMTAGQSANS